MSEFDRAQPTVVEPQSEPPLKVLVPEHAVDEQRALSWWLSGGDCHE